MPTAIFSFKIEKDSTVQVAHVFFGSDDDEAQANLIAHAEICPKFGPAYKNKQTIEIPVEIEALPEGDEEALDEWLDDEFLGGEEEEEEEEEEQEGD